MLLLFIDYCSEPFVGKFILPEINNMPIKLKSDNFCTFNSQIRAMTLLHNPLTSISK